MSDPHYLDQHVVDNQTVDGAKKEQNNTLRKVGYMGLIIACIIYLINPGGGMIEVIPDVLPIVGNLDEATVASVMVLSIQKLREYSKK